MIFFDNILSSVTIVMFCFSFLKYTHMLILKPAFSVSTCFSFNTWDQLISFSFEVFNQACLEVPWKQLLCFSTWNSLFYLLHLSYGKQFCEALCIIFHCSFAGVPWGWWSHLEVQHLSLPDPFRFASCGPCKNCFLVKYFRCAKRYKE